MNKNSLPQIIIESQSYPGSERFANDKIQKNVGVCVKKRAFPIILTSLEKSLNFSKINLTATLCYDEDNYTAVEYLEQVPITYKSHISEDKKSITLDVQILVLSSQYEGSLFSIKFTATDKKNENNFSECYSSPIKVVSKPSQLQAKAKKRTRVRGTPTKEMFVEAMQKLDKGQEEHTRLLAILLQQSQQQTEILRVLIDEIPSQAAVKQEEEAEDSEYFPSSKRQKTCSLSNLEQGKSSLQNNLKSSSEQDVDPNCENEFNLAFQNLINAYDSFMDDSNNIKLSSLTGNNKTAMNTSSDPIWDTNPSINNFNPNLFEETDFTSFSPNPTGENIAEHPVVNPELFTTNLEFSNISLPNLFDVNY